MEEPVRQWASDRGYQVAWGSLEVIESARADVAARRESRELDEELFREALAPVSSPELPEWAASLIVVAVPCAAYRVGFDLGDRMLEAVLPPTYRRYRRTFEEVQFPFASTGCLGLRRRPGRITPTPVGGSWFGATLFQAFKMRTR